MSERTALITGATSGIGLSGAQQLVDAGWDVWVSGRRAEAAEEAAARVGGRPVQLDVTDAASIAAATEAVGELDVLVNNAGIQPDAGAPLLEADADLFRTAYDTNVFGVVSVTNAFLPALRGSSAQRIVNVSSGTSSFAWSTGPNPQFDYQRASSSGGRFAVYRSSKVALNGLTLLYSQTLEGDGFKVNALAPGARNTNLNDSDSGEDAAEGAAGIVILAELPDDGPTGRLFSWDGTEAPW